jgi:hypothetical protein
MRPVSAPEPTGPRGRPIGCFRRGLGCLGLAGATILVVGLAFTVLAGAKTRLIRRTIAPGMSVAEVVDRSAGWLICRARAGREDRPVIVYQVWSTSYGPPWAQEQRTFPTTAGMAQALAAEMGRLDVEWTMTFGYKTIIPRRIYFDVVFIPGGRVGRVSPTYWGRLD